ncbi:MAG TPA: peptidylprolyl isomerase [Burkholderiaceae bacterium]|nr:peptidylprolyl isomerase [Burkholderiaceae bacterium]
MTESLSFLRALAGALVLGLLMPLASAQAPSAAASAASSRTADYIVAVVNQELVTNGELEQRIERIRNDAARSNTPLPPPARLRQEVLNSLINERVQLTHARDSGQKIDDAELDRAVTNVAAQNQLSLAQLLERLAQQGISYGVFRNNVRDQMLVERVREREVNARIHITEQEIDALLEKHRAAAGEQAELNIAQILVSVPEDASDAAVAQRRARAEAALARVKAGESFAAVARDVSEDGNRERGGEIGLKPVDRLPTLFVDAVRPLKDGEVTQELLRSGAGFHVLKLIERRKAGAVTIEQTHARHILLRPSAQLSQDAARERLAEFKREILSGAKTFEQLARANSEDASAAQGGDLGWTSPGAFVPEFEKAMNDLPINGISEPFISRFGVHLVQVLGRREVTLDARQEREQARNVLREQKFRQAYADWVRDLRARAYVDLRDPPL